jgi:hypothetical protein
VFEIKGEGKFIKLIFEYLSGLPLIFNYVIYLIASKIDALICLIIKNNNKKAGLFGK